MWSLLANPVFTSSVPLHYIKRLRSSDPHFDVNDALCWQRMFLHHVTQKPTAEWRWLWVNTHIVDVGNPLNENIVSSPWEACFFCLSRPTGPSPALLVNWTPSSWRRRRCGSWSASPSENKTSMQCCASFRAASLLLMDINIYVVLEDFFSFHNEGEPESCGEMMKWSVSGICAHMWMHKCTSHQAV